MCHSWFNACINSSSSIAFKQPAHINVPPLSSPPRSKKEIIIINKLRLYVLLIHQSKILYLCFKISIFSRIYIICENICVIILDKKKGGLEGCTWEGNMNHIFDIRHKIDRICNEVADDDWSMTQIRLNDA